MFNNENIFNRITESMYIYNSKTEDLLFVLQESTGYYFAIVFCNYSIDKIFSFFSSSFFNGRKIN